MYNNTPQGKNKIFLNFIKMKKDSEIRSTFIFDKLNKMTQ